MKVTRIALKDKKVAQDSFLPESNNSRLHTSQTLHIATSRNIDENEFRAIKKLRCTVDTFLIDTSSIDKKKWD